MSDKKNYGETDSIKAMLERLRRSVTDLPPEESEEDVAKEAPAEASAADAQLAKTIENVLEQQKVSTDVPPAAEESTDIDDQQNEAEDTQEECNEVGEEMAAPALEEIVEASSTADAEEEEENSESHEAEEADSLVLLPWEEDSPILEEKGELSDEPLDLDVVDGADLEAEEEDPFFAEEIDDDIIASFFTSEEEQAEDADDIAEDEPALAEAELPSDFVDVVDDLVDEDELVPVVTDDEAAKLFKNDDKAADIPVIPLRDAAEEEKKESIVATVDNGYAVEVEVKRPVRSPAVAQESPVEPKEDVAGDTSNEESGAPVPEKVPQAATQGLSNGETVWRDGSARRRPVEIIEAESDEQDPPAGDDAVDFWSDAAPAEEYVAENEDGAAASPATRASKEEGRKETPYGPGVQISIEDIKKEKERQEKEQKHLFARIKEKIGYKPAADQKTAQPSPQNHEELDEEDMPSSRHDVLAGLYQEEAAAYNEYTSRNQISTFRRKFESELSFLALRIGILSFLSVFLLLLENGFYWGIPLERLFVSPVLLAGLHLILLFFALLCCIPLFSHAWRQLFARRTVSELFVAIGLLCAVLYGAILCFSLIPDGGTPVSLESVKLFGLLPVFSALVATVMEFCKAKNDLSAFELISSGGDKLACSVQNGATTNSEAAAVSGLTEGERTRIVSVKKVGFTSGFFHRITRNCEDEQKNLWLIPTACMAALVVAIVTGVMGGGLLGACYAFCVTLSLSLPLFTLVLHKVPVSTLFRFAALHSCAVVGEVSAIEYSDTEAFAFEDVEAFSTRGVRVQRIKLYHDSALDQVLYQVAGVFSLVGGPLDGVFRNSTADLGLSDQLHLLQAEEGGVIATVDGKRILVGNGDFMLKQNVKMYYDAEDEQILANGKTCIMYAAEERQLHAKFYIRYRMNEEFERDVERLAAQHIRVLIRTFDPNIRKALIDKISYAGKYDIRVVRKTVSQQKDYAAPQINSGIVTRRSVREIVRVLLACRRTCRLTALSEMGGLVIGCVGMLFSIIVAALGGMLTMPSWGFALYQLIWILPIMLASKILIARK